MSGRDVHRTADNPTYAKRRRRADRGHTNARGYRKQAFEYESDARLLARKLRQRTGESYGTYLCRRRGCTLWHVGRMWTSPTSLALRPYNDAFLELGSRVVFELRRENDPGNRLARIKGRWRRVVAGREAMPSRRAA